MKSLIIGGAGFVGAYLIRHLRDEKNRDVFVTKMPHETITEDGIRVYDLNILDKDAICTLLEEVQPDEIFHLAAQSSVAVSWKNPALTVDVNVKGAVNVLDAVRETCPNARVLLIGSGEEYGHVKSEEMPIVEENAVRPGNIYAATKVCQNLLGAIYAEAYNMDVMMVRAFNHIGPNQIPQFVVADFCKQVADIESGRQEPVMKVGNLSARRDFTDVRDVVRAYGMIIEKGTAGETYNVGSGHAIAIQEILDKILEESTAEISVEKDPSKFRPVDVPVIEANTNKLREATGWEPQIPLTQTIKETVNYWRNK